MIEESGRCVMHVCTRWEGILFMMQGMVMFGALLFEDLVEWMEARLDARARKKAARAARRRTK